jgi:hypothetical protein
MKAWEGKNVFNCFQVSTCLSVYVFRLLVGKVVRVRSLQVNCVL